MGNVIAFPTSVIAPVINRPPDPASIPEPEDLAEFDFLANRLVNNFGSIDGEEFWSEVEEIKALFADWASG